jgi:hypothetical protein
MTVSVTAFGTPIIGQTGKALNAILARQLAGTGITEPQWVTLVIVNGATFTAEALVERVSGVLKVDPTAARERIAELTAAGMVRTTPAGTVEATEMGRARWSRVRAAIAEITEELWGDLPEEDLATAGRVLPTVLTRANTLLLTIGG